MTGWGNNPATVEAAATALAVFAVFFAWLSLRESKVQRLTLEAEAAARMRPWVGLFDFGVEVREGEPGLRVLLRNFGALPAQRARLRLVMEPREAQADQPTDSVVYLEQGYKALMPTEDGDYHIGFARYPRLNEWMAVGRDVVVNGTFEYALAGKQFQSEFTGILWFSRSQANGDPIPTNWKNSSAT